MKQIIVRFLIGGLAVSFFSVMGDVFKPKSFAGLFGAAPSVALATLGIAIFKEGRQFAAIEAHSMIAGSIAFFVYTSAVSWILMRRAVSALWVTTTFLLLWAAVGFGLWCLWLR
ncbi:MAG TPA: DUF3147 family protein [Candidatus Sulfotelmatobacter sp.]|nr:DUF3147 family protein [Candidatus Sulfotelmatobacter sp.]